MDDQQIHFEVFARRTPQASMVLEMACEDRARAVDFAEGLIKDNHAVAVRVTKETRDAETGEYRSVTVLAKGTQVQPKSKGPIEEAGPACVSPADLYSIHARQRIVRLLEGWLNRNKATPFELLHRPDLAERLEASGTDLQHAVQKIAIPEAQAKGVSVHEVIRSFNGLIERAINRLIKDGRRGAMADFAKESFAEACTRLVGDPEAAYRLGGGVAGSLANAKAWSDKIDRLLDLADQAPAEAKARRLVFDVIEQPLGEIMGSRQGMAELLGPELDLGGQLTALTRLIAGRSVGELESFEPAIGRLMPPLEGAAQRLSRWLEGDYFQAVRTAIGHRILQEIKASRRLRPTDAQAEIDILRVLAMALTASAGRTLSMEDIREVFIERSQMMVGAEFITAVLSTADSATEEVLALVRLAENVLGPTNKRQAGQWLIGAITALRFEKEVRESKEPPGARLFTLAKLQRTISRIELPEQDRKLLTSRVGEVGGLVEADAKLVESVLRAPAPPIQRIGVLLKLATGESAPLGPAADRAKAAVLKMTQVPEVRADLAKSPEMIERLRPLMRMAS